MKLNKKTRKTALEAAQIQLPRIKRYCSEAESLTILWTQSAINLWLCSLSH